MEDDKILSSIVKTANLSAASSLLLKNKIDSSLHLNQWNSLVVRMFDELPEGRFNINFNIL